MARPGVLALGRDEQTGLRLDGNISMSRRELKAARSVFPFPDFRFPRCFCICKNSDAFANSTHASAYENGVSSEHANRYEQGACFQPQQSAAAQEYDAQLACRDLDYAAAARANKQAAQLGSVRPYAAGADLDVRRPATIPSPMETRRLRPATSEDNDGARKNPDSVYEGPVPARHVGDTASRDAMR